MSFDITDFQTVAANLPVEGEVCDVNHAKVSIQTEINAEMVSLQRELVCYTQLTQMASFTAKIIFDTISQWHPLSNPQKPSASEVTVASTKNNMGAFEKTHHHAQRDTFELGEDRDVTKTSASHANAGLASPSLCSRACASDRGQPAPDETY